MSMLNVQIYIKNKTFIIRSYISVSSSDPQSGDSQSQETFLAPSADKQTRNYDTECSNYHLSLSALRSKGLSCRKMKW